MKKVFNQLFLSFCFLLGCSATALAAPAMFVSESPAGNYGTPATVSVSSWTLTCIPDTQNNRRVGFYVDAPNTNTGYLVGMFGDCTSAPAAATVRPIEINPDSDSRFFAFGATQCLWVITSHTSAENAHYQEVIP